MNTTTKQLTTLPDLESDVETTDHITKEMLIGCLPDKRYRGYVTDDLVDLVNSEPESEMRRVYRDNVLNYTSVLVQGRYSLSAYINAVKFVSLKLLGNKSSEAYKKVFPDRYLNLLQKNTSPSQIASFADNYAKTSLVVKIMEQTIVPTHILNANIYQEAINVQAGIMKDPQVSSMVRMKAAACLIENLRAPEVAKVAIDVNYSNDVIDDLRATTRALAQQQKALIETGKVNAKDIAESDILAKTNYKIIDAVLEDEQESEENKEHISLFDSL